MTGVSNYGATATESAYAMRLIHALERLGYSGWRFVVDTGRNGGEKREDVADTWCNRLGAGAGTPATAETGVAAADAYFWIKPPGESDGVSTPFSPRYDAACGGASSLSDAPQAGEWFHEGFVMLAKNAHPPWDAARVYDPQVLGQPLPPPSPPPPPGRGDGGGDDGGGGGGTTSSAIGLNVAPSPPGHDYDYDDLLLMFAVPPAPPPPPPSAPSPPPPPPTYGVIHVTDAVVNGGSGDGDGVGGGGHRAHRDDGDHEFARLRYSPPPPTPSPSPLPPLMTASVT